MFRIVREPIEAAPLADDRAGGYVTFEGRVRNHNEGQTVQALEYEAYDELAVAEGERILEEARRRFEILDATCIHRAGLLAIGDVAIRVEVSSAHRRAAFDACEYVVDEVKRRVPIWKKEHYVTGASGWINCHTEESRADGEAAYYARQMRLPQVGPEGQGRLRAARVLMVGAGGLGSAALPYLAAAGVGTIGIADADVVDLSNLHRQTLYRVADVGRPKAEVAAERLRGLNPYIEVAVYDGRVVAANADELLAGYDVIVDGTDNFSTKFLLNDVAVRLGKPLVQASLYQAEGQMMVVAPGGPCLRCLWPEAPEDGCVGNCAEVGVLGVVPGVFGALQATEALKLILGIESPARDRLVTYDLLGMTLGSLLRPKNPDCPACRGAVAESFEVDPSSDLSGYRWIDVREDDERAAEPIPLAESRPMSSFDASDLTGGPFLLVCARGARSARLVREMRAQGRVEFWSLPGGLPTARRLGR